MDNIVTLNQLLNIGELISNNATANSKVNQLLDEYVCNQYDHSYIKQELLKLFATFKSARYLYDFPVEENIKMSPNYELREGFTQRSTTSQVENAITRYIDKQILTTDIYYSIIKASYKLTDAEVVYLQNTFLTHKSEEDISELVGISKTYLQKIKKSCLIKLWVELEKYCIKDD